MKNILYLLFASLLVVSIACERETFFELSPPSLLVRYTGPPEIVQEPGNGIFLEFELQAASGLSRFDVLIDGELYESQSFENMISTEYTFEYTVPEDQETGTENLFSFELVDADDRIVDYQLKLTVRQTFNEETETINGIEVTTVKGRVNSDYTFEKEKTYMIDSVFSIENESILTIEEGSIIYFRTFEEDNLTSRLVIAQGSRVIADGTPDQPIVFTSDKVLTGDAPSSTDWGGIIIYGRAPSNQGNVILDEGYRYAGNVPNDNSGILRYVRIEYAGKNGFHGLALHGVGSGTRIENVQVFRNENTSFRVRGGRVSLKNIAGIGHGGYGIWADDGWQGNGQFWLFQTDLQATLVPVNFWNQARSIEFRNDANNFELQPRTQFRVTNVTLIGNGYIPGELNGTRRGLRIRRGATGIMQNVLVTEFPNDATRVEDLPIEELGSSMIFNHIRSFNNGVNFAQEAESIFFESGDYDVLDNSDSGVNKENFVGADPSPFDPNSLGAFFSSAPYMGAVENSNNDWTSTGSWFKNLDGTIR